MEIKGRIVSISGNTAEVCIIRENSICGSCSTCPKKMGIQEVIQVAVTKGIQVGQEVILRSNRNWFMKNKIMVIIAAFVLGAIITETISMIVLFNAHNKNVAVLGGGIFTLIVIIALWIKRPRYLFRIESIKGGKS